MRDLARVVRDAKAWHPATFTVLSNGVAHRQRNVLRGVTDRMHLESAAEWLAGAQDAARDGGIAGRYRLGRGWTSSYPETTGYIIPTMLALESDAGIAGFKRRAERCIGFLLGVQLASGAFPGMEIAENRERPSIFNSAQILHGLTAWHEATGDEITLTAARRVAEWLVAEQDSDGAWRTHLYGSGRTYTYMAHAGCWLAAFGLHTNDRRYLDAARRHLEWVLTYVDEKTGWINDCGFEDRAGGREAVTHTIAYTIWGVLMMSHLLGHERGFAVARRAAQAVARRLELSKWLPGRLDAQWKSAARYACLTGNAQMALIWFELHRIEGDPSLVNAACRAIDLIKQVHPVWSTDPNIRGGIAGSDPSWGAYVTLAYPNWAAKFFIDALLIKNRTLKALAELPCPAGDVPTAVTAGVPLTLPPMPTPSGSARPRVVLLTDESSPKVEQFAEAWKSWGFKADAVVIRSVTPAPRTTRIARYVREYGLASLARRLLGRRPETVPGESRGGTIPWSGMPVLQYCESQQIPTVVVGSLDADADLDRVRAIKPDLFVYAGCGIMRPKTLAMARLGTVNGHMGMLPQMRGMNVAEWSAFIGAPVGCTVHLINAGIDTGSIVLFRPVDILDVPNIDLLRHRVDIEQIRALGEVVQWILEHGALPPMYAQRTDQGRQYFAMHDDLRALLQAKLRSNVPVRGG